MRTPSVGGPEETVLPIFEVFELGRIPLNRADMSLLRHHGAPSRLIRRVSTLSEAVQAYRQGKLSPSDLVDECARRASASSALNAFVTEAWDEAHALAADATKRFSKGEFYGPLDGIPVSVKDNFTTKGLRTTAGSRMLASAFRAHAGVHSMPSVCIAYQHSQVSCHRTMRGP